MSKTETQSEALRLAQGLADGFCGYAAWLSPAAHELRRLDAENKVLKARLAADIDPALSREVYRACEDLPEDWAIRIDLQNGYGAVKLVDPDGEESELPVDGMLSDAMRLTIDTAMAAAKTGGAA